MDRFDMRIRLPKVRAIDLASTAPSESSARIAKRVATARAMQAERAADLGLSAATTNAQLPARVLQQVAQPDAEGRQLLMEAAERLALSARAYHRVLKVARTLADLAGERMVRRPHVAEALAYRGETARQGLQAA